MLMRRCSASQERASPSPRVIHHLREIIHRQRTQHDDVPAAADRVVQAVSERGRPRVQMRWWNYSPGGEITDGRGGSWAGLSKASGRAGWSGDRPRLVPGKRDETHKVSD